MRHSAEVHELAAALSKAQGEIGAAEKLSENPFYHQMYADLASVWRACRKPLADNGLAIVQGAETATHGDSVVVTVTTLLIHVSGQWAREELALWPKDASPQGIGSAVSYGRRYSLAAMVGVYQGDDDGEVATGRGFSQLEGGPLTPEVRDEVLPKIVTALNAKDGVGLKEEWDALSQREQSDLWKLLNNKQRTKFREVVQDSVVVPLSEVERAHLGELAKR